VATVAAYIDGFNLYYGMKSQYRRKYLWLDVVHLVRQLRPRDRPFECACPATYRSYEEKETDVALGVAMVEDAALGVGDITLLISADSDMIPALRAVKHIAPDRRVYVALPPSNQSRVSPALGVGVFHIRESALAHAQLPPAVTDPVTGRKYTRPPKWT
jgi:hypothetical protein